MDIISIMESNIDIKNILKECPYDILSRWEIKEYSKGEIICYQDEKYEFFYIIVKGYVNISLAGENGKRYSQAIYKKGDYFGELEIFDNKPYICSIEAIEDVEIIRIDRKDFLEWIHRDKYFLLHLTKTLCDSFYKLSQVAGENALYSLRYRICNYLLYKLDSGTKSNQGIKLVIDKEHLSERFAVTPRSINRILRQMKKQGLIDVSNDYIYIVDIEGLGEEEEVSKNE